MKKVLVLVGPTGVGKTEFSIELAKKYNAEVISGDSIQVFKGLDIGSGKIKEEEMQGVLHHGLDILSFKESYSVADFQTFAKEKIDEIHAKGKLPMIVGGTGLYIKACLYDYVFEKQQEIDSDLLSKYEGMSNDDLYAYVQSIDPLQAQKIHINNRKRLLRAALIYDLHHETKSDQIAKQDHKLVYDAMIVGCTMERERLYQRINQRVEKMIEEGLEKEIQGLLDQGINFDDHAMQGIGYREWRDYFEKVKSKEEVIALIQKNSRQFAKRQYTWFNHQMETQWVDVSCESEKCTMMKKIEEWMKS